MSARDDVVATLVAQASGAEDLAGVWPRILEVLRSAWRAERAVVVREQGGATALVAAVPAGGKGKAFDPNVLADALGADDAVAGRQAGLLAIGVRPAGDGRWGVGLVRAHGNAMQGVVEVVELLADVERNEQEFGIVLIPSGLENSGDGQFFG